MAIPQIPPQNQTERLKDLEELLRTAMDGRLAGLWTTVPGIVDSINSDGTANVQPTTQGLVLTPSGKEQWINMPLLLNCPILRDGGGGWVITFPVQAGDEVVVFCASRCITNWFQKGGIQTQASLRMHSLSDGFVFCGPKSLPNKIPNISQSSTQLRSLDGTQYLELATGGVINIVAPGGVHVTGPVIATGEGTFNGGHTVSAHKHTGVTTGSGVTGVPEL